MQNPPNATIGAFVGNFGGQGIHFRFDGTIDEVAMYDRALSAEEIHDIYCSGVFVDSNTVGYWNFDEGFGQVAYDSSGNNNDGYLGTDPCGPDASDPNWVDANYSPDCTKTYLYVDDDANDDPCHGVPSDTIGDANFSDPNEDGTIEHPFDSIQKAIDYATDYDCGVDCVPAIIVLDGVYTGVGNRDIDANGLAVTIRSENGPVESIINCEGSEEEPHRAFIFDSGEGADTVIDGFTITGGYAYGPGFEVPADHVGGAIYCYASSPTITNCIITDNYADWSGGGIWLQNNSNAVIRSCTIIYNDCEVAGGGINSYASSPTIQNCIISNNSGLWSGAMTTDKSSSNPTITNCTIAYNSAAYNTGGIECYDGGNFTLKNSILWGNSSQQIHVSGGSATVTYSDVWMSESGDPCWPGTGNINSDPLFADANDNDYHLKSNAGRWFPLGDDFGIWVSDALTSGCIDAGDPNSDYSLEPSNNGELINMGAYGNTDEASKSF